MFEDRSQQGGTKAADASAQVIRKTDNESSVNFLSVTKNADAKGDKNTACCPCCGACGGCCCGGKKDAGKTPEEKDAVEKGIDYVKGAGFPKVAAALKSAYDEGKSLLMTPLDAKKAAGGKAGCEGCPCGCGGAGACCAKTKDGKHDDKEKSLKIPPLETEKKPGAEKKAKGDQCEGCKCGCGGAGGCVCDSKKTGEKDKEKNGKDGDLNIPALDKLKDNSKKDPQDKAGCCAACGAKGGCCCDKEKSKKK